MPKELIYPKIEKEILDFWDKNQIFSKSLAKNPKDRRFVFYEGPPTANAKPGIHHAYARTLKDLICRYKTQRGFFVLRKAGWDTHGLPVEIQIEKALGISSKPEIEKYGIKKFCQKCQESVWDFQKDWEKLTKRIGYWLDLDNPYITYQPDYIESVWWALKKIWDLGLIYQDYKVVPYCPRCGTTLSDHEVALGYKKTRDPSVYIKFKVLSSKSKTPTYFLVWTTTPWTLPANVALAVGGNINYLKVKQSGEIYILAEDRLAVLSGKYQVLEKIKGKDLIGLKYQPLFEFSKPDKQAYLVVAGDFVSTKDGTGVVHLAPAFGAEDMNLAKREQLAIILNINSEGRFKKEVKPWAGMLVKDADGKIIDDLANRKLLYQKKIIKHTYPFCWRCNTPLLYYAKNTWFIKTTAIKLKLLKNNRQINWIPDHFKNGRFGNWLESNVDWAISRDRYWGTPIPIWQCRKCHHTVLLGSFDELKKIAKSTPSGFHRPEIDQVKFDCPKCQAKMTRITQVLDAWFDSGSMPFAQWHYPFNNKEIFKQQFPADFIAEGQDQTRGWFYTLLAISSLIFNKSSYKNVISHGLILDEHGIKMSKSKGNIINPENIIDKFGADSTRFYLTLTTLGEYVRFSEKELLDITNKFISTLWNSYQFLMIYSKDKTITVKPTRNNILDEWILSELNLLIKEVTTNMEKYQIPIASRKILKFVDFLSNWYIRRSRKRTDFDNFLNTLSYCLLNLVELIAPFCPFISEKIYQDLRVKNDPESVHLTNWPDFNKDLIQPQLNQKMMIARNLSSQALSIRAQEQIKVRQPLSTLVIWGDGEKLINDRPLLDLISDETNVEKILVGKQKLSKDWKTKSDNNYWLALNCQISSELKNQGLARELVRKLQEVRKLASLNPQDNVEIYLNIPDTTLKKLVAENLDNFQKSINAKKLNLKKEKRIDFEKVLYIEEKEIWVGIKK